MGCQKLFMKNLLFILVLFIIAESSLACTTFCINHEGQILFGRNYDWVTGVGIVHTNQRGLIKTSMRTSDEEPLSWVSKFGSITFNQYGKEFPTSLHTGDNSLDRFIIACNMIEEIKTGNIKIPLKDYAFSILDKVSQGSYTKWSIVYDITNKKVYFRTEQYSDVKNFSLDAFNYSCHLPPKMYDMNMEGKGDITANFTMPVQALKLKIVEQAISDSRSHVKISEEEKQKLLKFEESVKCNL